MKENVMITITGLHPETQGDEPVSVTVLGTYMQKDNTVWLIYDEADEDGNVSNCRMKVQPGAVEMTRKGSIVTQMFFAEGENNACIYETIYGQFEMNMVTEYIHIVYGDPVLMDVELRYQLFIDGRFTSNCELHVVCERVLSQN